ncbi:MAG: hypothetical protein WBC04_14565 [Candidatus Acidiferrales bacterium]
MKPRCVNCHGAIDPFAPGTLHGGPRVGQQAAGSDCSICHSNLPPQEKGKAEWRVPDADFLFQGRSATTLCKQMKRSFSKAENFVLHILNDNGNTNFNGVAFLGTRGLNELGQSLVEPSYVPQPPEGITLDEFLQQSQEWVAAMGGEFKGDFNCGCEPVHYAIRVQYIAQIQMGTLLQTMANMGPVDIPITFHDDGSFEGQGILPFSAKGSARAGPRACNGQSQGAMMIKVSGNAIEDFKNKHMHIEVTNLTPESGSTAEQCNFPPWGGNFRLIGGDKATFGFDLVGRVGEAKLVAVPLPGPGINARLGVEVVELGSQPPNLQ